jgi:hypothetical protein
MRISMFVTVPSAPVVEQFALAAGIHAAVPYRLASLLISQDRVIGSMKG